MKESGNPATPKSNGGGGPEFGAVTIDFRPGPDSGDRLRRLLSLMVRYDTRDNDAGTGSDPDFNRSNGGSTAPEHESSSRDDPESDQ